MPLNKQGLHLQLDQGINTKVDDKDLPLGQFELVENVSFEKTGEFNKRYGYDHITGRVVPVGTGVSGATASPDAPIGVSKYKNQLLWLSRNEIYTNTQKEDLFQGEGSFDAVVPKSNPTRS